MARFRHLLQETFGPAAFVAVPAPSSIVQRSCDAYRGDGDRQTAGLPPQSMPPVSVAPDHKSKAQAPDIHVTRVEPAFGDFYGVCACGARSLPCDRPIEAEQWVCPFEEATVEVLRNRLAWEQRVLDAAMYGAVR